MNAAQITQRQNKESTRKSTSSISVRRVKSKRKHRFSNIIPLRASGAGAQSLTHALDVPQLNELLRTSIGPSAQSSQALDSNEHKTFLAFVCAKVQGLPPRSFEGLLTQEATFDAVVELLILLAKCMIEQKEHFSIDKTIRKFYEEDVILKVCSITADADEDKLSKLRCLLFQAVAWITCLYPAKHDPDPRNLLRINTNQCICAQASQPSSNAVNPFCEVIQEFGDLLPVHQEVIPTNTRDNIFSAQSLYVSLLNAKTLSQLGGIEIEWVDNVASHLVFDQERMKLILFCLPSFTEINRFEDSAFSSLMEGYYDDFSKPTGFSCSALFREIRLSYRLLFADDNRSRHLFRTKERKKAATVFEDPHLSILCLSRAEKVGHRNSYSKSDDFPILAARFSILQDYIQRQNPTTIKMLWYDRRNMLAWYTFWAVALVGVPSIILSMVQTGLAAAQLYYTIWPTD